MDIELRKGGDEGDPIVTAHPESPAAQAIVEIAISKMSLAVREVSVAKGYDPRDFALVASGGAGPLHVCAIARELFIPTVIVPLFPSHFSALGMLLADERHDFTRTVYSDLAKVDFGKLVKIHDEMVAEAKAGLRHGKDAQYQVSLDIRYMGQEFTLSVPVGLDQLKRADREGIRIVLDASASMYHMQFDGRLGREVETAMMIKKLLYNDRFSIEGARHALRQLKSQVKEERNIHAIAVSQDTALARLRGLVTEIHRIRDLFN